MFYTSDSMRLISKLQGYLELIRTANNIVENQRINLRHYDNAKDMYAPIRLMTRRRSDITDMMERYMNLSNWLIVRYQKVFTELGTENLRQMKKEIDRMIEKELQTN